MQLVALKQRARLAFRHSETSNLNLLIYHRISHEVGERYDRHLLASSGSFLQALVGRLERIVAWHLIGPKHSAYGR